MPAAMNLPHCSAKYDGNGSTTSSKMRGTNDATDPSGWFFRALMFDLVLMSSLSASRVGIRGRAWISRI